MRKRLFAWLISQGGRAHERALVERKRALLGGLSGQVVEIGPGAGINLPYFAPDVRWIGVEPNPHMDQYIHRASMRVGRVIDVKRGWAERLPMADRSVDAVVSTLVLCSVADPAVVLREVRRVLRPGGSFAFVEHVGAPHGSRTRRLQSLIRPLWAFCADGCHPDRDLEIIVRASGFAQLKLDRFDLALPIVGPHIAGVATTA